jgi:ribonuclease HI
VISYGPRISGGDRRVDHLKPSGGPVRSGVDVAPGLLSANRGIGSSALCERTVAVVWQAAGSVASPSDLTYDIWTDGACAHKTSGAGGYAAVLVFRRSDGSNAEPWELSGGAVETTNNRMELMAVIAGLRALPAPARVCVHIDSTYVMKNFKERLERWQGNGWRTADGKPVKNQDLWEQLSTEVASRKVDWVKVAGHTGDEWTEYADKLACAQRDAYAERSPLRPVK